MDQSKIIVSCFQSATDTNPRSINLLQWLEGSPQLNKLVDAIRAEGDKDKRAKLKKQLPAITPSGTFSVRRADGLVKHSGLIALDFDNCDPEKTKKILFNIVNIYYAGLSASARGIWALVPVYNPEQHKRHFEALRSDMALLGLEVDKACGDVSRLRFYSYDPEPIFNLEAVPYRKLAPRPQYKRPRPSLSNNSALDLLIGKIETTGQDITSDYKDWLAIGSALASIYGEAGRDRFHRISQFYPDYSPQETDKQFDICQRYPTDLRADIVFRIAKDNGVLLNEKHMF